MTAVRTLAQLATATRMLFVESTRELGLALGFTIVFPIGILFFLNALVAPAERPHVLVGTIMMEMALLNINALAQSIGQHKESRLFDLWVSLPVRPLVYVLAVSLTFLPYSLASAVVTLSVATLAFGVPLSTGTLVLLVPALVLTWGSTLGIGFLIGAFGRSPRQINTYAQLVGVILTFFAPVFYPVGILPTPLQTVAYLWPMTWGTVLLNGILLGSAQTVREATIVLAAFVALWLVVIGRGVRWRQT